MKEVAPFFAEVAEGPTCHEAAWLTASDGQRLRAVLWPEGERGTVLIFAGRTECAEKYGRLAADLGAAGYASATVDWRGQGLSGRLSRDPAAGHVGRFNDYQLDAVALLDWVRKRGLPEPYFLIGHSMGGCIGLRALMNELPVAAAAFSAPMWGISTSRRMRLLATLISNALSLMGQGQRLTPGTVAEPYLLTHGFEGNDLTTDPEMYDYMRRQVEAHPELSLCGPSAQWLRLALAECAALMASPTPKLPTLVGLGTDEAIVDPLAIQTYAKGWAEAELMLFDAAQHELLMEAEAIREAFLAKILERFESTL